jgi:hypothetical protein
MPSALAARKAALAAQALKAGSATPTEPKIASPVPRAESLSLPSSDDIPGPSKRRKVNKKTARYFAPESEDEFEEVRPIKKRSRTRKFSPSAPASEADDGMGDSSDESGTEDGSSVGEAVDEGRVVWTTSSTPATSITPVVRVSPGSRFKPVMGTNVQLITEEELSSCGIKGNESGSGLVISLGKQDVSTLL